ncbi:MAG: hypothetical protein ACKOK8_17270, partial [Planctomycetia bacterium]
MRFGKSFRIERSEVERGLSRCVRACIMAKEKEIRVGSLLIPAAAIEWQFARSSGPGGQHVNRTSSKALLRFDAARSPHLP